jgi:ABC-type uncharacterized transport system ATPase subunit
LREAASCGTSILVHSPDIDELLVLATRVVVTFEGRLVCAERDRESIGRAMVGTR